MEVEYIEHSLCGGSGYIVPLDGSEIAQESERQRDFIIENKIKIISLSRCESPKWNDIHSISLISCLS